MEGNAHKRQRQNGMGGGSAGAGDTNQPYDRDDQRPPYNQSSYGSFPPINLPPLGSQPSRSMSGSPTFSPYNRGSQQPPSPSSGPSFMMPPSNSSYKPYRVPSPPRTYEQDNKNEMPRKPSTPPGQPKSSSPINNYSNSSFSRSQDLPSISAMGMPPLSAKMSVSSMLGDGGGRTYRSGSLPPFERDPFRSPHHSSAPQSSSHPNTPGTYMSSERRFDYSPEQNRGQHSPSTLRKPSSPPKSHSSGPPFEQDKKEEVRDTHTPSGLRSPLTMDAEPVRKGPVEGAAAESSPPVRKSSVIVQSDKVWKSLQGLQDAFLGHFLYSTHMALPCFSENINGLFTVRIPAADVSYKNPRVQKRALWGTDIYSDDSDIAAMVIHMGLCTLPDPLTSAEATGLEKDLLVRLRVVPRLEKYSGSMRHMVQSRPWEAHDGVSLAIVSVEQLSQNEPINIGRKVRKAAMREYGILRKRAFEGVEPDAPVLEVQDPWARMTSLEFNSNQDPSLKYSHELLKLSMRPSSEKESPRIRQTLQERLVAEVLFLENDEERYEISRHNTAYRFAVVKAGSLWLKRKQSSVPLEESELSEVVGHDLSLVDDLQWVATGVVVKGPPTSSSRAGTFCLVKRVWWVAR